MYRHTQVGYWTLVMLAALCAAVWWRTGSPLPATVSMGVVLVVWSFFGTLTTEVTGDAVNCRFGPLGLIRKRLAFADIRGAAAIRTSPLWGWGLRLTPRGWLWNVWGLDAVEFEMTNGTRFAVGTDEPQALIAALRRGGADHVTRAAATAGPRTLV